MIALLSADAGLREAVPAARREEALAAVLTPALDLDPGPWQPDGLVAEPDPGTTAMVMTGLLVSEVTLAGAVRAHLLGPGDLFLPWDVASESLPAVPQLTVGAGGARVAVLGASFRRAELRWPQLAVCTRQRWADQARAAALRTAIVSLPRVEQRVLALFWHLADRWGTVYPEGVRVRLKLTHELIGRMAGAKRPTVSLAISLLAEQGMLRTDDGTDWWLSHPSTEALRDGAGPARLRPPLAQ